MFPLKTGPTQARWESAMRDKSFDLISLHSYRYAWAERAKTVGMPERFAQQALGHSSKAFVRAYSKKAKVIVPSLEDYEAKIVPMMSAKMA